jgi:Calcineurin-like phosphoesterase
MRLQPEEIQRTIAALEKFKRKDGTYNWTQTADELDTPESTVRRRAKAIARSGGMGFNPVLPSFEINSISTTLSPDGSIERQWVSQRPESGREFEVPEGHVVKGVSSLLDSDGRVRAEWIKTREGVDPKKTYDDLVELFSKFEPCAKPVPVPKGSFEDQLVVYPFSDPHFGLYVWGREASESWDLQKATAVILETFQRVIARTPRTNKALLIIGGDTMHADNGDNKTAKSGNALQVDGRYPKVLATACETIVHGINLILSAHKKVEVIVLPGNHDEHSAHAISLFLKAWYRKEPRVVVDDDPSLFRFREFGKVMIGTTHGHAAKPEKMPEIMASREAAMWGRTEHRYVHTFHVHHQSKRLTESGGCIIETHRIIAPQDAWHWNEGFLSGRSMQSIHYDREIGEISRATVNVIGDRISRGKSL